MTEPTDKDAKRLTVHNASVTTMTVEVKTLTIGARQVTQGIFRQLIEEPLIAEDGTLNGVPWGHVTWHPDKCDGTLSHRHIVWQRDSELRRARIIDKPRFGDFECPTYGEWALTRELERLRSGERMAVLKRWRTVEPGETIGRDRSDLISERVETVENIRVAYHLTAPAMNAVVARHELAREEKYGTRYADGARRVSPSVRQADQAAFAEFEASCAAIDGDASLAAALKLIRQEIERRDRYVETVRSLAELPQLFIGG